MIPRWAKVCTGAGLLLIALACTAYRLASGEPEVHLPWSTPATRVGSVAGVIAIGVGAWLLVWLWLRPRSRRRRQSKRPRAADDAHGAVAVPLAGVNGGCGAATASSRTRLAGADGYVTAGSTRPPRWSRPEDQTIPFPSPAVPGGGQWDGRQVHPPGHVGRPTTDVRSSRTGVRVERLVPASARGGVEAGTPQLPPSCLERGARRRVTPGCGGLADLPQPGYETWARPATAGDGPLHETTNR